MHLFEKSKGHSNHYEGGYDQRPMSGASWSTSSTAPPAYNQGSWAQQTPMMGSGGFAPTTHLQIQTRGVTSTGSLSCSKGSEPIPVFRAQPGSSMVDSHGQPEYVSFRTSTKSNSCALVRGGNGPVVSSTIYRRGWGSSRNPRINLLPPNNNMSVAQAIDAGNQGVSIEVKSKSMMSRTERMDTPFGSFQWRYGDRGEKKEYGAYSLLILEQVGGGKIAEFLRNDEFRTPGTTKWMAGNGGRLMLDMRMFDEKSAADVEAFIVASLILMLKKEVDRMREGTTAAVVS